MTGFLLILNFSCFFYTFVNCWSFDPFQIKSAQNIFYSDMWKKRKSLKFIPKKISWEFICYPKFLWCQIILCLNVFLFFKWKNSILKMNREISKCCKNQFFSPREIILLYFVLLVIVCNNCEKKEKRHHFPEKKFLGKIFSPLGKRTAHWVMKD